MTEKPNASKPILEEFSLAGKVALVTGASGGLGSEMAIGLAEAGADLALVARRELNLEALAGRVRAMERRVAAFPADVSRVSEIQPMVDRVVAQYGRIDILVNAAGVLIRKAAIDLTEEEWDRANNLNLKGLFFCSQAVAKQMVKQGGGKIINVGSLASSLATPNSGVYAVTKTGVLAATRAMAVEWAQHGINVNCIGPGYFQTEMTRGAREDPARNDWILRRTPMRRWGLPCELRGVVLFLASDASDFITGQLISIDGGVLALL